MGTEQNRTAGRLSPLTVWALAFGCAVGWGAFVMPGTTFLPKAGPLGTVLGVFIGGLCMCVIAWNYHVMMVRSLGPGGAYAYATEAFGIDHGFLCAWFLFLAYVAIVWANATALAIVAHYTLGDIFKFGFHYRLVGFDVWLGDILLAAAAIAAAAGICRRRRIAGSVQRVLGVGFALGILVSFVAATMEHEGGLAAVAPAFAPEGGAVGQVLKIVALSPWLFVGFESISHASGEFGFPVRRTFAVMAAALAASVLAYGMLAVLPALVPIEGTKGWPDYIGHLGQQSGALALPTFATASRALGRVGVAIIGVTMFGAIFTGLVGNIFAASRLVAAMSDDGIFPRWCGERSDDGSPGNAVLAIAGLSIFVPFFGRTAIGFIVDVATIGAAIAYAYTSAATWRLSHGDWRGRTTGLCGVALSIVVLLLFIVPNYASGTMMATESYLLLVLWSILGFLVYRFVFLNDRQQRFGKSTVVWLSIISLVGFMSLMWMRQATGDTTRRAFDEIERVHDEVFPEATSAIDSAWDASLAKIEGAMNKSLVHGSLVQTGLMIVAFFILFNIYAILRRREREAEEEKTRAKSYFFSTVSHDIRTPLNAIIGFSEMLKTGFKTEAEHDQAVDSILASGKTLLDLINDVLDLSKLESGKMVISPEPTDCPRLLREIADIFRVAKNKPSLELRLRTGEMPVLMLDPLRLRQIVFNLVGNAVKFTEKGFVELRATFVRDEGAETGTFRLEVEDTGSGISEEDQKRISSAYVQVGSKMARNGGTGLGLAISKQLAEAMGGALEFVSELGKGSTFSVTIRNVAIASGAAIAAPEAVESRESPEGQGGPGIVPAATSHSSPVTRHSSLVTRPTGAKCRVLLVDDAKMNLMVLRALLKQLGSFEISLASDGNEALKALKASSDAPFTLVLTDMWMPNLDGEGLLKAIREDPALAGLRVIVVTADVELRTKGVEMGFDDILLKPVTSESLTKAISAAT